MNLREGFELLATAPGGVARLRELILSLAVQGKLVPANSDDESAESLLTKIQREKSRLIAKGTLRRDKPQAGLQEEEKPFELPHSWSWVRLGSVCGLENGDRGTNYPSKANFVAQGIPFINAGHLRRGRIEFREMNFISPESYALLRSGKVQAGDVLYCLRGSLGKTALIDDGVAGAIASSLVIVRFVPGVNQRYAMLYFDSPLAAEQISKFDNGTAQPNLGASDLAKFAFPLPPLAEQRRIVAKVDELMKLCDELESHGYLETERHASLTTTVFDALVASESTHALAENWSRVAANFDLLLDRPEAVDALEQTIVQLAVRGLLIAQNAKDEPVRDLLQRIRVARDCSIAQGEMKRDKPLPAIADEEKPFALPEGWEWVRFGDVVQISGGVTLGRKTPLKDPVSLPYLRVANVQRRHLVLSEVKDVIIDRSEIERFRLLRHDLLITEGGDWDKVGRTCLWRDEIDLCLHQNHIFKARGLIDEWCPEWAELFLNSPDARAYFASSAKQTTNLASINMSELKRCVFPAPPVAEQIRIVARVTELRQLCTELRIRLTARQTCQAHFATALVEQTAAAGPDEASLALAA